MLTATLDMAFRLPAVKPMEKPMAFTEAQLQSLVSWGRLNANRASPLLHRVLARVQEMRGASITYAFSLSLNDLITWSVRVARGSMASLPAPLVFFKPEKFLWIPKVVISVCREFQIDPAELESYHATCHRASIEFMSITEEHIENGYLDRKDFKRAFNGALFCDRLTNSTLFCPTLRDWGFRSWDEAFIPSTHA